MSLWGGLFYVYPCQFDNKMCDMHVANIGRIVDQYSPQKLDINTKWLHSGAYVVYPWELREKNNEGDVVLSFTISSNGAVIFPEIAISSGSQLFDMSALHAVSTFVVNLDAFSDAAFPKKKRLKIKFRMRA